MRRHSHPQFGEVFIGRLATECHDTGALSQTPILRRVTKYLQIRKGEKNTKHLSFGLKMAMKFSIGNIGGVTRR